MNSVHVVYNKSAQVKAELLNSAKAGVSKACFDTEAEAKRLSPVDTGAMRSSIYSSVGDRSTYEMAASGAKIANSNAKMLDEVKPAQSDSTRVEGIVACGVEYGFHVEYGTHGRAGQPFMTPAAERIGAQFARFCENALKAKLK